MKSSGGIFLRNLSEALEHFDLAELINKTKCGIDVNQKLPDKPYPLQYLINRLTTDSSDSEALLKVIEYLLQSGANPTFRDTDKCTLLEQLVEKLSMSRFLGPAPTTIQLQALELLVNHTTDINTLSAHNHPLWLEILASEALWDRLTLPISIIESVVHRADNLSLTIHGHNALDLLANLRETDVAKQIELMRYVHEKQPDLAFATDKRGNSIIDNLYHRAGPEVINFLIAAGSPLQPRTMIFLLKQADTANDQALITLLFSKGVATITEEASGLTALHVDVSLALQEQLLAHGANPNAEHLKTKETPLLIQIQWHRDDTDTLIDKIESLHKHGANLSASDADGKTALHYATERFDTTLVQYLLQQSVAIDAQDDKGNTALHIACKAIVWRKGAEDVLAALIAANADTTIQNTEGKRPLDVVTIDFHPSSATQQALILIVDLIKKYPDALPDSTADALLQIAIQAVAPEADATLLLEILAQREVNFTNVIRDNYSAAFTLISKGHKPCLAWLLAHGLDPNIVIKHGERKSPLLHLTIKCVSYEALDLLLHGDTDMTAENGIGDNVLHVLFHSVDSPHYPYGSPPTVIEHSQNLHKIFKRLLSHPSHKRLINHKNHDGISPLYYLLRLKPSALTNHWIKALLKNGATLDQIDKYYQLEQIYTAIAPDLELLKSILAQQPTAQLPQLLEWLSIIAIRSLNQVLFNLLLKLGLDINQPISDPRYRSLRTHLPLEQLLHGTYQATDNHKAIDTSAQQAFAKYLLENGASIHYLGHYSFWYGALYFGWTEIVQSLLDHDHTLTANTPAYGDRYPAPTYHPLLLAIKYQHPDIVAVLLKSKANLETRDHNGKTPLLLACELKQADTVVQLLEAGAIVNAQVQTKWHSAQDTAITCLLTDTKDTPPEIIAGIITLLLNHGYRATIYDYRLCLIKKIPATVLINIYETLPEGIKKSRLVLDLAINLEHEDMALALLAQPHMQQLIHEKDISGQTPLHYATHPALGNLLNRLLELGATVDQPDYAGFTPAHHAFFYETLTEHPMLTLDISIDMLEFDRLCAQLLEHKELEHTFYNEKRRDHLVRQYAYKLISLFTTCNNALSYIQKYHSDTAEPQSLHDLCLFNLPTHGTWDRQRWAQLIIDNLKAKEYLKLAPSIEAILGHPPESIIDIETASAQIHYTRTEENPELARLLEAHHIAEEDFNYVLDYKKSETLEDHIPDISIDGALFGKRGYYFTKLKKTDLRGLILGQLTNCCQSVGGAGSGCAMHGMFSPDGGFYVIFKRDEKAIKKYRKLLDKANDASDLEDFFSRLATADQKRAYRAKYQTKTLAELTTDLRTELAKQEEGQLVAQCWAWLSDNDELVFDSWERLRDADDPLCEIFLKQAAIQLISKHGMSKVLLGKSGQTPRNLPFRTAATPAYPKDYFGYRDSIIDQWEIPATRPSSPTAVAHTSFFTPAPTINTDEFKRLLQHHISAYQIMLFEPVKLNESLSLQQHLNTISIKPTEDAQSFVIPWLDKNDAWNVLVFIYDKNATIPFNILHLDTTHQPSLRSTIYTDKLSCFNCLGTTTVDCLDAIKRVTLTDASIAEPDLNLSALWIIAQLRHLLASTNNPVLLDPSPNLTVLTIASNVAPASACSHTT